MRACLLLALLVVASPAPTRPPQPRVTVSERKAIFNDWYADGRIDGTYSCAVVQNAIRHLPQDPPIYSTIGQDFQRYERGVC